MYSDISSTLDTLQDLCPLNSNACCSYWEVRTKKLSRFLQWTGCALFLLLCLIVLVFRFILGTKPGVEWQIVVLIIVISTEILAMTWLVLDIVSALPVLIKHQEFAYLSRKLEIEHDISNALRLLPASNEQLQFVEKWLAIKIERTKSHIALLFGNPDKVAIFALAGMGWLAWKELQSTNPGVLQDAMILGLAFLGGSAIGAILHQRVLKKMAYQKDLVSLAIVLNDTCTVNPDMSSASISGAVER